MKVEKNNNSIFRNKHVLVVVAVMCIFTIIACMGFMLSVPAQKQPSKKLNRNPKQFQIISTTMSLKSTQLCGPLAFQRPVLPQ